MGIDRWRAPRRALICALAAVVITRCDGEINRCARASAAHAWGAAFSSCQVDYRASGDPARAIDAARAAFYLQRPDDTLRLASEAIIGPTAADAHQLVGFAQLARDRFESSVVHLSTAIFLHSRSGQLAALSRDFQQLSGAFYQHGYYQAAFVAEGAGREVALRAHDDRMTAYFEMARGDILRQVGDMRGAEDAIDRAVNASAGEPNDLAQSLLKRAALHVDQGKFELAREPLTRALAVERAAAHPRGWVLEAAHLDLAFVERKAGSFDQALVDLQQATLDGTDVMTYHLNRGLVFADMGALALARDDLARAEAEPLEGGWTWWVPFQRAQVAAKLGDLATAISEDRVAIAAVAQLAAHSRLFGPTMIASHRGPHLHLIGMLAGAGRWRDVLEVIAAMDSQSLLRSDMAETDIAYAELAPGRPSRSVAHGSASLAVEAWRGQRLVVIVPGGNRVWRIELHAGDVTGSDAGALDALAAAARQLEVDPGDLAAGRTLGDAMLPPLIDGEQLAVLAVGPLARAPLAGLRIGDAPAIAHHGLVRAQGVLPRTPVRVGAGPPLVLGDPTGDLPAAADEARRVASQLGATLRLGHEATRAALFAGAGSSLLHVAGHTATGLDGAALVLADGSFSAAELAQLSPAPRLVILAGCGAAAGRDDAGHGSLANALLDAGTELVVGTRWSVDDADAARLMRAFYAAGGAVDPVRALAHVQLELALPIRAVTRAAFEIWLGRPSG